MGSGLRTLRGTRASKYRENALDGSYFGWLWERHGPFRGEEEMLRLQESCPEVSIKPKVSKRLTVDADCQDSCRQSIVGHLERIVAWNPIELQDD